MKTTLLTFSLIACSSILMAGCFRSAPEQSGGDYKSDASVGVATSSEAPALSGSTQQELISTGWLGL